MAETLVKVNGLTKEFPVETSLRAQLLGRQKFIHAVEGVDLEIEKGQIYGLAGESGCGKTTTGRCLARLENPTDGEILFGPDQNDVADFDKDELLAYRRQTQIVFQDPYESLNDRFTVRKWVREPLRIHDLGSRDEQEQKVRMTLDQCGLKPVDNFIDQFPHELSGGQRQRVALARAMVLDPSFIIADEPTSMLDVSMRAGILSVFKKLTEENDVTILYISHDLSLLRYICDQIGIMYQGEIVEKGDANTVLQQPKHPYTQSLLSAVPRNDPTKIRERVKIPPEVKERIGGVEGCPFKYRCAHRFEMCDKDPEMLDPDGNLEQYVSCHLYDETVDEPLPQYEE